MSELGGRGGRWESEDGVQEGKQKRTIKIDEDENEAGIQETSLRTFPSNYFFLEFYVIMQGREIA